MLMDHVRTEAFRAAIDRVVRPGMTVLDFGTGSGVLSFFAARAGATRVYAVDRSPFIRAARAVAKHNQLDSVTFIQTSGGDFELPEQVDVLVSECIGHYVLNERMVDAVLRVRSKHLKPAGAVIPSRLTLKAAIVGVPHVDPAVEYFDTARYGIDFAPLATLARSQRRTIGVPASAIVGPVVEMASIDLRVDAQEPRTTRGQVELDRDVRAYGLAGWFEAELAPGIVLRTGPDDEPTHWQQSFFPFASASTVRAGRVEIAIRPHRHRRLHFLAVAAHVRVDRGRLGRSRPSPFHAALSALTARSPHHDARYPITVHRRLPPMRVHRTPRAVGRQ